MKNINFCIFALFYIFCPLVSHSEPSNIEPSCLEAKTSCGITVSESSFSPMEINMKDFGAMGSLTVLAVHQLTVA